jgi:Mn-dependent DtxR family transcriptional regulator
VGEASLCDKARLERLVTATDESYHEHIKEMIQENHEIKQKATALKVEISKETVGHIINLQWALNLRLA